ncbi:hypothetical protein [Yoonia litorea]|uniref:Uncharacterized protein n=1 Tax=Yoonia litorea TaxID=1123755 RepID=A0A1I6L1X0_9RHOB|nr:hypothetical protein [Yoonia litorea]SFR97432.1 hypothetical protein SAMN05444714_0090 [Yoonia litorea]
MSNVVYLSRAAAITQDVPDANKAVPASRHFDSGPIRSLYDQMPVCEAENQICDCLEQIAADLDLLQQGLSSAQPKMMEQASTRIASRARKIGLLEVALSAEHVRRCVAQRDGVATEATIARLERSFDFAVNAVWTFRGL